MWACRAVLLAVLCYAYTVHSMLESDEDDVPSTMSLEQIAAVRGDDNAGQYNMRRHAVG